MTKTRTTIISVIALLMIFSMIGSASAGVFDFLGTPSQANPDDEVFEAIGGTDFLNATLKGCLKVNEENIPDGSYESSSGKFSWYDAKNITYVDTNGNQGYMIVWKASSDKYPFNTSEKVNQYSSNYLIDGSGISFVEYSYEDNYVYGILLGTENISYTESELIYDILGLNRDGFELTYSVTGTSYSSSGSSSSSGDHYHTVVQDRYSLSRSDPDSYYDHYEYGDNYEIDDYLESEGYD